MDPKEPEESGFKIAAAKRELLRMINAERKKGVDNARAVQAENEDREEVEKKRFDHVSPYSSFEKHGQRKRVSLNFFYLGKDYNGRSAEIVSTNAFFAKIRITKRERRGSPGSGSILEKGSPQGDPADSRCKEEEIIDFQRGILSFPVRRRS